MKGCTFLITVCTLILLGCQSSIAQDEQEECSLNEEDVECVNPCNVCESQNTTCQSGGECVSGCDCKSGFLRNKFGYCIPKRFCGAPELHAPTTEEESTPDGEQVVDKRGGCPDAGKCNRTCESQGFRFGLCHGSQNSTCTCDLSVLPIEKGKKIVAESGRCPSVRICELSCIRRGFKTGLCFGPGNGFCNCYSTIQEPTEDGNREVAESGGCPSARICNLSCNRRGFKSGLCLGPGRGFCNCYSTIQAPAEGGNREVAESGGCPSARICNLSCNRRGFKTGLCLGPGRGFCNCYSTLQIPSGSGTFGNREVADSGGCPSTMRCIRSCNRRNFETGICLGPRRGFCNCYSSSLPKTN